MSMLGRRVRRYFWRYDGHEWGWRTPDADRSVRFLKFKEKRQWRREYEDELDVQDGEDDRPIGYVERWPRSK